MSRVRLEVMPWLNRYFGTERSQRVVLESEVNEGATVRDLLERISSGNQELRQVLFDARTGRLSVHITLTLNGRFVELSGGLEARLRPGDTIRIMPALGGG